MSSIKERCKAQVTGWIASRQDELVVLLQRLIQARSDYPPGDTRAAAEICLKVLSRWGIEARAVCPPPQIRSIHADGVDHASMPSVIGTLRGGEGPCLLLNAHIDTVPAGDAAHWRHDPFGGQLEDGFIYGRGAGDDKGSVAAQLMAVCAVSAAGVPLAGTLQVNPVADEEASSFRGAKWLCSAGLLRPDMVIVGEQTANTVCCAERAIANFLVRIHGRACHGAMPWQGSNATVHMARFIGLVNDLLAPELAKTTHPYLPPTTLSATHIRGGHKVNIIPELCELELDCRMVPGVTEELVRQRMEELLNALSLGGSLFEWEVVTTYSERGLATNTQPDTPLIRSLLGEAAQVQGTPPALSGYKQASDGRVFAGLGVPIAIFGPGDPALGHSPEERVSVRELVEAAQILARTAIELLVQE